jgi:hypothetical protein
VLPLSSYRPTTYQHSQMELLRIPFRKAYNGPKILYEDRKARFGRQRFVVEGGETTRGLVGPRLFPGIPPLPGFSNYRVRYRDGRKLRLNTILIKTSRNDHLTVIACRGVRPQVETAQTARSPGVTHVTTASQQQQQLSTQRHSRITTFSPNPPSSDQPPPPRGRFFLLRI